MKGWFRPLHRRLVRVVLAAAVSVPTIGATHVLPVSAVGCNPPVPCVDNSVTYQGSVDEIPIWTGAVETLVSSVEGDSSPVGQVVGTVGGANPLSGDGCVPYNCTGTNGTTLKSAWYNSYPLKNQPANGSENGAFFWPTNQPDSSGTIYAWAAAFTNASRRTNDICSVGNSTQMKVDGGQIQAVGGTNGYQPNGTNYYQTGASNTYGLNAQASFDVKAVNVTVGISGSYSVAQAWVTWGGYDGNRNATWVATRTNDSSCHGESYSVTDMSPWQWDNPSGYVHFEFIWSYSYHN